MICGACGVSDGPACMINLFLRQTLIVAAPGLIHAKWAWYAGVRNMKCSLDRLPATHSPAYICSSNTSHAIIHEHRLYPHISNHILQEVC